MSLRRLSRRGVHLAPRRASEKRESAWKRLKRHRGARRAERPGRHVSGIWHLLGGKWMPPKDCRDCVFSYAQPVVIIKPQIALLGKRNKSWTNGIVRGVSSRSSPPFPQCESRGSGAEAREARAGLDSRPLAARLMTYPSRAWASIPRAARRRTVTDTHQPRVRVGGAGEVGLARRRRARLRRRDPTRGERSPPSEPATAVGTRGRIPPGASPPSMAQRAGESFWPDFDDTGAEEVLDASPERLARRGRTRHRGWAPSRPRRGVEDRLRRARGPERGPSRRDDRRRELG